jgi:hypothetical protein
VALVMVVQYSHRQLQLTQMLWYGTGASEAGFKPMWTYPKFDLWYYVWMTGWSRDALVPLLGLGGAGLLALRQGVRAPSGFLLLILLTTCGVMALLLSVKAWRYSYHLMPLLILLAAAALHAGAGHLLQLARTGTGPGRWRPYAYGVATLVVLAGLVLGNGLTLQLTEMEPCRLAGIVEIPVQHLGRAVLVYSDYRAGARFVRDRLQAADVVLTDRPQLVDLFLGRPADYFLQSKLHVQAVLDDQRPLPLHHYTATVMLSDLASLEHLFARHQRIWYIARPQVQSVLLDPDVAAFLRQQMDVVYEDFSLVVLCRSGASHRPASLRRVDEQTFQQARANLLR